MNLRDAVPLVIYDDKCYACTKFAKIVNFLSRGKITMELRNEILDSTALLMFWFVDGKIAYGGRAALFPLFLAIFRTKGKKTKEFTEKHNCSIECKNPKAVFLRSASLITNYKKIRIKSDEISI